MHALGHAGLALAAAGCARALAGGGGGGRGLLVAGSAIAGEGPRWLADPLALAGVGLAAVLVKGLGASWAAFEEARIAGDVAASLRLEVLDGWLALHRLRSPRQRDQGVTRSDARAAPPSTALAALTDHVRELETGLAVGALGAVRAAAQIVPLAFALAWMAPRLAIVAAIVFASRWGARVARGRGRTRAARRIARRSWGRRTRR